MNKSIPGQIIAKNTTYFIDEINKLLHKNLNQEWVTREWRQKEKGVTNVHPFINNAYLAHQQINEFIKTNASGMTTEIFELAELAIKINALKDKKVLGIQDRIDNLTSFDTSLYLTARYEIQIAGMLLQRGYKVEFIREESVKNPDILMTTPKGSCEVECKHKEPDLDQIDYIRSIYNNTQKARKQFSKQYPGIIFIDIDKDHFNEFQIERNRLNKEIIRAMRNSTSISAIFLTSKICLEENNDFV